MRDSACRRHIVENAKIFSIHVSRYESFLRSQKQKLNFHQAVTLVTVNIPAVCLQRFAIYFKVIPIYIYVYKSILLHAITVRVIV